MTWLDYEARSLPASTSSIGPVPSLPSVPSTDLYYERGRIAHRLDHEPSGYHRHYLHHYVVTTKESIDVPILKGNGCVLPWPQIRTAIIETRSYKFLKSTLKGCLWSIESIEVGG